MRVREGAALRVAHLAPATLPTGGARLFSVGWSLLIGLPAVEAAL
jgi:hypothetical protein